MPWAAIGKAGTFIHATPNFADTSTFRGNAIFQHVCWIFMDFVAKLELNYY
jgi:hypothetical protein